MAGWAKFQLHAVLYHQVRLTMYNYHQTHLFVFCLKKFQASIALCHGYPINHDGPWLELDMGDITISINLNVIVTGRNHYIKREQERCSKPLLVSYMK